MEEGWLKVSVLKWKKITRSSGASGATVEMCSRGNTGRCRGETAEKSQLGKELKIQLDHMGLSRSRFDESGKLTLTANDVLS